jgi:hypothetical protein
MLHWAHEWIAMILQSAAAKRAANYAHFGVAIRDVIGRGPA